MPVCTIQQQAADHDSSNSCNSLYILVTLYFRAQDNWTTNNITSADTSKRISKSQLEASMLGADIFKLA